MNVLFQLYHITSLVTQDYLTTHSHLADMKQTIHAQMDHHRSLTRSVLLALWIEAIPGLARADIWNGGLCNICQQVLDSELIMIVSPAAFIEAFILWLLDDGHSKIKQNILRGFVGTMALINMSVLQSQLFNKGVTCTVWRS